MKRSLSWSFALVSATLVAAVAFAACESADAPGGPDGGSPDSAVVFPPDASIPDAPPPQPDAPPVTPPADAAPLLGPDGAVGVTCGAASCNDMQECCVTQAGGGAQFDCVDTGTCAGGTVNCDGPEDCMGNACCATVDLQGMTGDSSCSNGDTCMGGGLQLQLCHNDPDCPDMHCCPTMFGANYCAVPGFGCFGG